MVPKRIHLIFMVLVTLGLTAFISTPASGSPISTSVAAAVGDTYGPYLLIDSWSGKCLNNPGSSPDNNTLMVIWPCTGTALNERWDNESAFTTSDFWIRNEAHGKCLTVQNARTGNNIPVNQFTCTSGYNERWQYNKVVCPCAIDPTRNIGGVQYNFVNYWQIQSLNDGRCLTVKNRSRETGANLLEYDCDASNSSNVWQQWVKAPIV